MRDLRVVDMDQSGNANTTYLLIGGKVLAQNTSANAKANPGAEELTNGSDNALVNDFLAPALGCTPLTSNSLTALSGNPHLSPQTSYKPTSSPQPPAPRSCH